MTGLDVPAYRPAAGDALRAAQSVQRELSSLDPGEALAALAADMLVTGQMVAQATLAAMAVSVPAAEEYARCAREQASRDEALTPILAWELTGHQLRQRLDADRASAAVAQAFLAFRRVIEQERAR